MNQPVISSQTINALPPQIISHEVLAEKYCKGDETTILDVQRRVARALASVEAPDQRASREEEFLRAQQHGFIPAGRICSAAGTGINATLINCFVQPVGDSVSEEENGRPSIYTALAQAAETMRRGGGVGYDFSHIRPRGAIVKGTHSNASGPVSFMRVFDASCETVESAGSRRGAQMGVLRCDHPDVEEFIHAKDRGQLKNFNISVALTDDFLRAAEQGLPFELVHDAPPSKAAIDAGAHRRQDGKWVYRTVQASELLDQIIHCTYDHADPGVLFIDRINAENNLRYVEQIEASNPCGEQALPSHGCCCLGSVDLTRFVQGPFLHDDGDTSINFDWTELKKVVKTAVRMLDNVLDLTHWPLPEQRVEAMAKRRIGLGFLGLGSALVMLGIRYNSIEGRIFASAVAETMRDAAYWASIELAEERGSFPLLDPELLQSGFAQRLPKDIRLAIASRGLRNSHLLSIAPTGTITLAFADNASNGIEPAFCWTYERKKRMPDDSTKTYTVEDAAYRLYRKMVPGADVNLLPEEFVCALEMTADDHIRMLEAVQPFIDAAISKTVNVPENYPFEDFKGLYLRAWKAGLKGLATYRPNPVTGAVLSVPAAPQPAAIQAAAPAVVADDDPLRKPIDKRPLGVLPASVNRLEYHTSQGPKTAYITISFARVAGTVGGIPVEIERPVEFFMPASQSTEGQQWVSASMRMLSMVGRSGGSIEKALKDLRQVQWDQGPVRFGTVDKSDGHRAARWHTSEVAAIGYAMQQMLAARGFLDAEGNQIPTRELAARLGRQLELSLDDAGTKAAAARDALDSGDFTVRGKPCPECGAPAVQRVDGCDRCVACGHVGTCG